MRDEHLIRLPQLGLTMTEGQIVEWCRRPGDAVHAGDVLYIVETDKIANEIVSDRDGVLGRILVRADETVAVGTPLAVWDGAPDDIVPVTRQPPAAPDPDPRPAADAVLPGQLRGDRIIASPRARKIARERGIDLASVTGSGPRGRIVARDVPDMPRAPASASESEGESRALTPNEKILARHMARSQRDVPHFYLTVHAEISELRWLHDGVKAKPGLGHVTLTHWIATAVGLVIAAEPRYRTVFRDDRFVVLPDSDVGIAVAVGDALYAPVARNVGGTGLADNATRIAALVAAAHDGTLAPGALTGGATTVSNLGAAGVDAVFPLINPGQSSILGVGRVADVFRPDENGAPALKRELELVLACDHRVFNGLHGAGMLGEHQTAARGSAADHRAGTSLRGTDDGFRPHRRTTHDRGHGAQGRPEIRSRLLARAGSEEGISGRVLEGSVRRRHRRHHVT